jgi:tetratricopeptide (TPR) repeat protein
MKLMEFGRAQKDCEESLKLKPDFVKCWIRKGACFEAQKQHDKAMEAFRVSNLFGTNSKLTMIFVLKS